MNKETKLDIDKQLNIIVISNELLKDSRQLNEIEAIALEQSFLKQGKKRSNKVY